jgi:phosphoribosylamine--glycine ligase
MRVLGIGDTNDLASMYLRLQEEGHEVRIFASEPAGREALAHALTFTDDWRDELPWVREAADGVILFEGADQGEIQDDLRRQGYRVIGGSQFGDALEKDRASAWRCFALLASPAAGCIRFTTSRARVLSCELALVDMSTK